MLILTTLTLMIVSGGPPAGAKQDDVQQTAEKYLNALTGEGDDSGRDLLLGGVTMNAQMFTLENWRIASREPAKHEEGDLASVKKDMADLDKASRAALAKILTSGGGSDGMEIAELTKEDAAKLMGPTRDRANKFNKDHPVMAFVARVGKEVYWHPKNPVRPLLEKAGNSGRYTLDVTIFNIETLEGPRKEVRKWPLRVLRLKTDKLDTGWRILPASDWNAE